MSRDRVSSLLMMSAALGGLIVPNSKRPELPRGKPFEISTNATDAAIENSRIKNEDKQRRRMERLQKSIKK